MNGVKVRATVNLPGLAAGEETWANSDSDYIQRMIAATFLEVLYTKPVQDPGPAPEDEQAE